MACPVLPTFALAAVLSWLTGCAASQATAPHSLADQARTRLVAEVEAPPSDFDMQLTPRENAGARRFTKDGELTGSLRASSPTRSDE